MNKKNILPFFYNYIYLDPRKPGQYSYEGLNFSLLYEPFYVGKGTKNRYKIHLNESNTCNQDKKDLIKNIQNDSLSPLILLLNYTNNEQIAYTTESKIINIIKSIFDNGTLTNKMSSYPFYCSEETRKSFGSPKEKHPLWGIGHTEETKRKISKNHHDCSGSANSRAKTFKIISPTGEIYIITGTSRIFGKEHNINIKGIKQLKGGIFCSTSKKKSNSDGWSAIEFKDI